ncbi:MAG: hypothetical protein FWH11_01325 [Micrococcales bacterium]|nr:hypothetical protein [Micrococcales bacterium]
MDENRRRREARPARGAVPLHLTAAQCAEPVGVAEATWWSYVYRGRAPAPVGWTSSPAGRKIRVWSTGEVAAWDRARPSRG